MAGHCPAAPLAAQRCEDCRLDHPTADCWARKQGIASGKAGIGGASQGGYSALTGLVNDPGLYRCGVAGLAVTDLELLLKGSWWVDDDTTGDSRKYSLPEKIGDLQKDADMIIANSPDRQATRSKAPVMLAFGKRMREAGNEPVRVTYPGEGHGFGIVANRIDYAERMATFLAKHLQP
jgi:dipeptidyl aminopeptidase/acylaminoacyl peptidase